MRKIKFRGKTKINFPDNEDNIIIPKGTWIKGGIVFDTDRVWIDTIYYGQIIVENKTVGQYTGLKDKNGKEIYEGDIIRQVSYKFSNDEYGHKGFYENISKVLYKGRAFQYEWMKTNKIEMPKYFKESFIEVIGNIYDNPDLLKEKEQC